MGTMSCKHIWGAFHLSVRPPPLAGSDFQYLPVGGWRSEAESHRGPKLETYGLRPKARGWQGGGGGHRHMYGKLAKRVLEDIILFGTTAQNQGQVGQRCILLIDLVYIKFFQFLLILVN